MSKNGNDGVTYKAYNHNWSRGNTANHTPFLLKGKYTPDNNNSKSNNWSLFWIISLRDDDISGLDVDIKPWKGTDWAFFTYKAFCCSNVKQSLTWDGWAAIMSWVEWVRSPASSMPYCRQYRHHGKGEKTEENINGKLRRENGRDEILTLPLINQPCKTIC